MTVRLHECQSCGTYRPRPLLTFTKPLDGSRPVLMCRSRVNCLAANALHVEDMLGRAS